MTMEFILNVSLHCYLSNDMFGLLLLLLLQARVNVACASQSTQWRRDAKSTFTSKPEIQVCYHLFFKDKKGHSAQ